MVWLDPGDNASGVSLSNNEQHIVVLISSCSLIRRRQLGRLDATDDKVDVITGEDNASNGITHYQSVNQ